MNGIDSIEEYRQNKEKLQKEKLELQNKLNCEKIAKSKETDIIMMQRIKNVYKILISEKSTKEKRMLQLRALSKKLSMTKARIYKGLLVLILVLYVVAVRWCRL